MKGQIRAPKTKKVNSYSLLQSNIKSKFNLAPIALEKKCSAHITQQNCSDLMELDFDEEISKLSIINEIHQIKCSNYYDKSESLFASNNISSALVSSFEHQEIEIYENSGALAIFSSFELTGKVNKTGQSKFSRIFKRRKDNSIMSN